MTGSDPRSARDVVEELFRRQRAGDDTVLDDLVARFRRRVDLRRLVARASSAMRSSVTFNGSAPSMILLNSANATCGSITALVREVGRIRTETRASATKFVSLMPESSREPDVDRTGIGLARTTNAPAAAVP